MLARDITQRTYFITAPSFHSQRDPKIKAQQKALGMDWERQKWYHLSQKGERLMPAKILIIEDNVLNMKLFNDVLVANGYLTAQSPTGLDAIELCKSFAPDLVILDIQLPEISGFEIIEKIRADRNLKELPVIAITAFAMHGDEEKILASGCSAYLSKPISVSHFLDHINHYSKAA